MLNHPFDLLSEWLQLQRLLLAPPWGQPIHLAPFLFSITILAIATATIAKIIKITIILPIISPYTLSPIFLFALTFPSLIKYTTTPAMAHTAIKPGRKAVPKAPVVNNVPI